MTDSLNPEINPADLADSQVVRFKSFDGMEIPNILYKPHGADAAHKAPAVLLIHGGPGGQTRTGYSALTQYLVNHGYVVLGVNNRGSSGYGKTFYASDAVGTAAIRCGLHRGEEFFAEAALVDPTARHHGRLLRRYMVLSALAFRRGSRRVDLFGVSNWVAELIPPPGGSRSAVALQGGRRPLAQRFPARDLAALPRGQDQRPLIFLLGRTTRASSPSDEILENIRNAAARSSNSFFDTKAPASPQSKRVRAYRHPRLPRQAPQSRRRRGYDEEVDSRR